MHTENTTFLQGADIIDTRYLKDPERHKIKTIPSAQNYSTSELT